MKFKLKIIKKIDFKNKITQHSLDNRNNFINLYIT